MVTDTAARLVRYSPFRSPALAAVCQAVTSELDQGGADRILTIAASGLRTAKLIKGARLSVVKDGPPCITWTHAHNVNRELVNFLGQGLGKRIG